MTEDVTVPGEEADVPADDAAAIDMEEERKPLISARAIGYSAAFGAGALLVLALGLTFPIPGINVVTDPRESFVTLGGAFSGPIGAIIVGILAGILEPGIPIVSIVAHIGGALFMAFYYKFVTWRLRGQKVLSLGLWIVGVLLYYQLVVVPLFTVGLVVFFPDPEYGGFFGLLLVLWGSVIPEMVLTMIVTTIVLAAVPARFIRPNW
jgi:hypothetical protein